MKKLLIFLFTVISFAALGQAGSQAVSGIKYRVNDTTTYQAAVASAHAQGYADIYWNNQAAVPHWDMWNGSSYDHVYNFNSGGGGGGLTPPVDATDIADGSVNDTEFQYINSLTSNAQTQINGKQDAFTSQSANTVYAGPASGGAAAPAFRSLTADDLATLTTSRTVTSGSASVQTDNLRKVYLNSAGTNNMVIDLLAAGTEITFVNIGAGTWTLTQGSGITLPGGSVSIPSGSNAIVNYRIAATPDVYTGTAASGTVTSVGITIGTSGSDVNVSGSPVTTSGNITLNIPTASASNRGALSSTDWSTFNNKESTSNKASALTTMNNTLYPTTASLFDEREVTGADAVVQSDNGKTIYFNSASPFNFTVDALTIKTKVSVINIGAGLVTFINGSGVTYSGATTLANGESGMILYKSSTAPIIRSSTVVPSATSSTAGIAKLYTTTGSNTDGSMDQNSMTNALATKIGLSGTNTLTGLLTLTNNAFAQFVKTGSATASANNQIWESETPTLTFRSTAADVAYLKRLQPAFVATANNQQAVVLDVNATLTSGAFTGTGLAAIRVTNGSTNVFEVANTGNILFKDTGGTTRMSWSSSSGALIGGNATTQINALNETNGWDFASGAKNTTGSMFAFRSTGNNVTSSPINAISFTHSGGGSFNPASGSSDFNTINLTPTINQTGSASGVIRGLTYNPTLTAILGNHYGVTVVPTGALNGFGTATPTSTVQVNGSFATAYVAKTGAYTLTATDHTVEVTSGTHNQTLPTAVGCTGRQYFITNSGSGVVTVATTSSQTFVNVTATPTTLTLNQFQGVLVMSNGTNWLKVSTF